MMLLSVLKNYTFNLELYSKAVYRSLHVLYANFEQLNKAYFILNCILLLTKKPIQKI
jgi:hypothetical protein